MRFAERIARLFMVDGWSRHEEYFRDRHLALGGTELEFEKARAAYQFGYVMAAEERFRGRPFSEVEEELSAEWTPDLAAQSGGWETVRGWVNRAYHRCVEELGPLAESTVPPANSATSATSPPPP